MPVSPYLGVIGLQLVFDVVQLGGLGAPVYLAWLACRGAQCCLSLEKLMGAWGSGMGKTSPGLEILTALNCLGNEQAQLTSWPSSTSRGDGGVGRAARTEFARLMPEAIKPCRPTEMTESNCFSSELRI